MWMAAKYGGFNDLNRNGIPDPGEWENPDGTPKNFFQAKNLSELATKMENAFVAIARSISTGTATSASINTVLGGGISINTAYYPQYVNPQNESEKLSWVGTVYGLFVDKWDNLREDSNGDGRLTLATGNGQGDYIVTFNSVSNILAEADRPTCYIEGVAITRCGDAMGTNKLQPLPLPDGAPANIHKLKTVWDSGRWLAELDPTGAYLLTGSRAYVTPATKAQGKRLIYFSYPGSTTLTPFNNSVQSTAILQKYLLHNNYALNLVVPSGTQNTKAALTSKLISYVQGAEVAGWRSRSVDNPWATSPARVVWRLGDVINSKPIVVGSPSSNFDILYGSKSYLQYRVAVGSRRQVAYFGANDGMLHAINLGHYGSISEGQVGYDLSPPGIAHELGAEMWAYIPASILPHLQWLADPNYTHSFMVDLKPLLVDIKINGSWRTVIIGGLRLGGRPIENPNSGSGEGPFYSEIFCLDVTDPEVEPKFLWRYSTRELGLSVGLPTVVASNGNFYAVIPSGPVTDTVDSTGGINYGTNSPYDGYSDQRARLIILNAATGTVINTGSNLLVSPEDGASFFNEPFMPIAQDTDKTDEIWNNATVYYGLTISRDPNTCLDRGAIYRLRTVDKATYAPLPPDQWKLERFVSTDRPVTGAVNGTYDNLGQFWIFFATGRLWGIEDLTPCSSVNTAQCKENHEQYLYGIKEELNTDNRQLLFTDRTSVVNSLFDVTGIQVFSNGNVKMKDGTTVQAYSNLAQTIKNSSVPGYKRKLDMSQILFPNQEHAFEVNFYQPKLVGLGNGKSLISFTTFEPKSVASFCGELGSSYMYILDSFTGLASPELYSIFSSETPVYFDQTKTAYLVTGGSFTSNQINTEVTVSYTNHVSIKTKTVDNEEFEEDLPLGYNEVSSVISWREAVNTGFTISEDSMTLGLETPTNGAP
jgi:type IV pilus assembly protein PilY1